MIMRKYTLFLIFSSLLIVSSFSLTLNGVISLSKNPATLFKARDEIIKLALSYPSSSSVIETANRIYSKVKILESAVSTPQKMVAYAVIKEDKDAFYTSLSSTAVKVLPSAFSLVFNVLDIAQDYSNFFSHISDGDYTNAVKYFEKMRFLYKIPDFYEFLPNEDMSSLWSFLAQGIMLNPRVFDKNGAEFLASIMTTYDVHTLYLKTYVWLSGLSIDQAEQGISVVNFESLISIFTKVEMDPNLLQWKYVTSKYLSLYTSISNMIRQLSQAKELTMYIDYIPTFYRAIQNFPLQYSKPLSEEFSTYLDLLNQRVSTSNFRVSSSIISDIRKLAIQHPHDSNSPKLMALTLSLKPLHKKESKKSTSIFKPKNQVQNATNVSRQGVQSKSWSLYYYLSIGIGILIFFAFIPRVRLSIYRILKLKKMEMNFYVKMISKSPENFKWHLNLANFYEKNDRFEEAQREYKLAMKLMKMGGNGYEDSK